MNNYKKELNNLKIMTKSELKTGMLVQTRDGDIGLVIKKLDVIIFKTTYINISDYEEDLIVTNGDDADILKVSDQLFDENLIVESWDEGTINSNLLWERKEKPKETIKIGEAVYDKAEFEEAVKNLKQLNK